MKPAFVLAFAASLASACLASAQPPATMSADIIQAYTAVKTNIMKTAEKMPAENYNFKPTPELRTFAEVLDHITDSQMAICAAVAGDQNTASAAGRTTKGDVTSALNTAFAECDKAYGSLSDANAAETITTPRGHRSKLGALTGNLAHESEQYGILSMYLRLKEIGPPSSERQAAR